MKTFLKSLLITLITLSCATTTSWAKPLKRCDEKIVFMPKGQWFAGGTASYLQAKGDNYQFLMVNDIKGNAYTAAGKLMFGYTFTNDVAAGLSFKYSRTLLQIDNTDIKLSDDMIFSIKDYYTIQHVYTATAFLRTYINIGNSKRFGMFNDVKFNFGGGQGKIYTGQGNEMVGTYEKITKMGVTLSPGISVFATDFMAIEASIGILGINYTRTEQITNQVYQGSFESFTADFQINLLSVGLGITFFF